MWRPCWSEVMQRRPARFFLPLVLASAFLGLVPGGAVASPIHWTLTNVPFDDGGAALGTFNINVYGYPGDINVKTTPGTSLSGDTYTGVWNSSINTAGTVLTLIPDDLVYQGELVLTFAHSLTIPGLDPILGGNGGPSFECLGSFGCENLMSPTDNLPTQPTGPTRYVLGDNVASAVGTVPLPAALPLFAGAIGGLAVFRRWRGSARNGLA
jgi:hypothetical protein